MSDGAQEGESERAGPGLQATGRRPRPLLSLFCLVCQANPPLLRQKRELLWPHLHIGRSVCSDLRWHCPYRTVSASSSSRDAFDVWFLPVILASLVGNCSYEGWTAIFAHKLGLLSNIHTHPAASAPCREPRITDSVSTRPTNLRWRIRNPKIASEPQSFPHETPADGSPYSASLASHGFQPGKEGAFRPPRAPRPGDLPAKGRRLRNQRISEGLCGSV